MTQKNWPLLIKTFEHIVKYPQQWFQPSWTAPLPEDTPSHCGTAHCFAGWATDLAGFEPAGVSPLPLRSDKGRSFPAADFVKVDPGLGVTLTLGEEVIANYEQTYLERPGDIAHIRDAALAALGLTLEESVDLFGACNTLADIAWHLRNWAEIEGIELPPESFDVKVIAEAQAVSDLFYDRILDTIQRNDHHTPERALR